MVVGFEGDLFVGFLIYKKNVIIKKKNFSIFLFIVIYKYKLKKGKKISFVFKI